MKKILKSKALTICTALLLITSCGGKESDPQPAPSISLQSLQQKSPLKGVRAIEQMIQYRVVKDPQSFQIVNYLDPNQEGLHSMLSLMGAYDGNGLRFDYVGRYPNEINTLLWYFVQANIADELDGRCLKGTLHPTFEESFCKSKTISTAGLWKILVGSIPVEPHRRPRKEAYLEVTMSPYFLLEGEQDAQSP